MKLRLAISLITLSFALSSSGAKSPITLKDYIFYQPLLTNRISGTVLGDDGKYGYIRYEDFAFLAEAISERTALVKGISTNDFLHEATNYASAAAMSNAFRHAVIPYSDVGFGDADLFLSPDCIESEEPRVFKPADDPFYAVTSIVNRCRLSTNVYHFATNLITQVMTNGTVDVHTNAYAGYEFKSNVYDRVSVVTNVLSIDDLCTTGRIVTVSENIPGSWRLTSIEAEPRMRDVVTNAFGFVRQMRRSVPIEFDFKVAASNATEYVIFRGFEGDDNNYSSKTTSHRYHVTTSRTIGMYDMQTRYDEESAWDEEPGYPKNTDGGGCNATVPDTLPLTISNRLSSIVLTYGMAGGSRINKANAFAYLTCDYRAISSSHHTTSDGIVYDSQTNVNKQAKVVVPLGTCYRSEGETLTFTLNADPSIYLTAAELGGLPAIDINHIPTPPPLQTPGWYEGSLMKQMEASSSITESLNVDMIICLILYLNPKTILPDWTEYE